MVKNLAAHVVRFHATAGNARCLKFTSGTKHVGSVLVNMLRYGDVPTVQEFLCFSRQQSTSTPCALAKISGQIKYSVTRE